MRVTTGRVENGAHGRESGDFVWREFVPAEIADRLLAAVHAAKEVIFALTLKVGEKSREAAHEMSKRLDAEIAATQQ